ncbi:hypothetical protein [Chitinophaga sp. MM2321]|uniref:hypothetical protein n=1 Tax=Chitinophaga sp. MM2321 TaxID=3137178 RepID=UPI0032D5745D
MREIREKNKYFERKIKTIIETMLQKPEDIRQQRFLDEVNKLNLRFPGREIVKATGYNSGVVSEYLNSKKNVSERFLREFCKAFNLDFTEIFTEKPAPPGDPINRERALIKVLYQRVAKLEAERLGISVDDALDELDRDTTIAWWDLEKEKGQDSPQAE